MIKLNKNSSIHPGSIVIWIDKRWFTKFSEITQCNRHYAVQGHSRSPSLVPIDSSYATSYWLLSCTVSKIKRSIGPKSLYLATPLAFNSPDGGVPLRRSP